MIETRYLADANVLIALVDGDHSQHIVARHWFDELGKTHWGTCVLTQSGFLRLMTNPKVSGSSMEEAAETLKYLIGHPGHSFWVITEGWAVITEPFSRRIFGHQQVTDAFLLGFAVRENGVLVTFDKGLRHLAGKSYASNLLVLEG